MTTLPLEVIEMAFLERVIPAETSTASSVCRKIAYDDIIALVPPTDIPQNDGLIMILGKRLAGDRVRQDCPQNKRVELLIFVRHESGEAEAMVSWRDSHGKVYLGIYEIIHVDPLGNC